MREKRWSAGALVSLSTCAWLMPAVALAAPPAESGLPPWAQEFWESVSGDAMEVGLRALLAVLLFIAGWLVAKFFAYVVFRLLERTDWDNKIAEKLHIDTLISDKKKGEELALERGMSTIVYYLLMGLVVGFIVISILLAVFSINEIPI